MKNEEFDDAIRKRMESINQTYTEDEVERVFQHVVKHHPSWLLRWFVNSWFIIPLSAAAMVGATYLTVTNFNQKRLAVENIKKVRVFEKRTADTKFKYNLESRSNSLLTAVNQPRMVDKHEMIDMLKPLEINEVSLTILLKTDNYNRILFEKEMLEYPLEIGSLSDTIIVDHQLEKGRLFPTGFRLSAGMPMSSQSYKMGLSCELLVGKHFGFSTGIRYSRVFTEEYRSSNDLMNHDPHGDIKFKINKHVGDIPVANISLQNNILQIPVFANYYFPLSSKINFSFALGTNIDFYLRQEISFTHQDAFQHIRQDHFKTLRTVDPFNNIAFAFGVEKRWRGFGLQVRPFMNYQIKEVFYRPRRTEYGVEFGVTYSFMRKNTNRDR